MIDWPTLLVFTTASLSLNFTPGNDMLFCLGQGVKAGPRAGFAAAVGITTGGFVHAVLAALGVAALVAAFPLAFEVIRWAGIAYLLWLAFDIWRNRNAPLVMERTKGHVPLRAWREGMIVNLLNPKVIIFMLAFVPQFVDPARGSTAMQFLILGSIINLGGLLVNGAVGVFAGSLGQWFATRTAATRLFNSITAVILVALALRIAVEDR
ncbi:MAG: LysE family translocator [Pseudomonadota bacterium]